MIPLTWVKRYQELGFVVHPCCPPTHRCQSPGKIPYDPYERRHMEGWQNHPQFTLEKWAEWLDLEPEINIGFLTGSPSRSWRLISTTPLERSCSTVSPEEIINAITNLLVELGGSERVKGFDTSTSLTEPECDQQGLPAAMLALRYLETDDKACYRLLYIPADAPMSGIAKLLLRLANSSLSIQDSSPTVQKVM